MAWIGKQNIPSKKVYFSCILQIAREIEDNGYHATLLLFLFWGVGGGEDKQGALSGLGEIVNFPFVELLSYRIPVSKVFRIYLYTNICFNYSSFALPNVLWAEFFSDEITCGRLLLRENFAMDGLRVAGTDPKEMKLGLTEANFCFVFDEPLRMICT